MKTLEEIDREIEEEMRLEEEKRKLPFCTDTLPLFKELEDE